MISTGCKFFEFELTNRDPTSIVQGALDNETTSAINTMNAHSFNVSLQDANFHRALLASDSLVADGVGVVWAAKAMGTRNLKKVSGYDLFAAAMEIANHQKLIVGFLGSTPEVLEKIKTKAAADYPDAVVKVLSPPFASEFSEDEAIQLIGDLGHVDILFVGMTAPKQEKFVYQFKEHITARVAMSIGAVFDFYSGTTKRPHPIFIRMGLEWLGRSIADPKKLGKRNLVAIPKFVFNCIKKAATGK
jgi:N-acetylglucosaminyldiphosphoundecaprenol N-acetyl-beta-D-mannosaminyltransferase